MKSSDGDLLAFYLDEISIYRTPLHGIYERHSISVNDIVVSTREGFIVAGSQDGLVIV
jgi:hypothetical protein